MTGPLRRPGVRTGRAAALGALVLLFFLEAHRVLLASLFGRVYDAVFPAFRPGALWGAAAPLLAVAAPLAPLARWIGHRRCVVAAVLLTAVARVPMVSADPGVRLAAASAVVAGTGLFLAHGTGVLERRGLAAGAAVAVGLDLLRRLAGGSYDPGLRPAWLPAQLALSLVLVLLVGAWSRARRSVDGAGLERRAGGLRLRGALMLGAILFLETTVLGMPEVGARWTGVAYPALGFLLVLVGAGVAALLLGAREPAGRHSPAAAALALAAAAGVWAAWSGSGWVAAAVYAAGHGAALLLLGRALSPAAGRRGGGTVVVMFTVLLGLATLYALSFFYAFTVPAFEGAAPWVLLAAGVILAGAAVLVPRPPALRSPPARPAVLALLVGGLTVPAAALALRDAAAARHASPPPNGAAGGCVRVATYNVHYGFGEDWRYRPEAMADVVAASRADVVALQEVPVGLGTAYGTDLAHWFGRRLGMRPYFAPSINGLLGDAVLTRLPVSAFESSILPPPGSDRKQAALVEVEAPGGALRFIATHLGLEPDERAAQIEAVLALAGSGPAVVAGDLNAGPDSRVARRLREEGFLDAFAAAGAEPEATAPASAPRVRIDWIWVRGYRVVRAHVVSAAPSDHRAVVAELCPGTQP